MAKFSDDEIDFVLRHDPLDALEKATGESHRDLSPLLLFSAMANNGAAKQAVLQGDSHSRTTFQEFLNLARQAGFTCVLSRPFSGFDGAAETFDILFHEDGIVLCVESYGDFVNKAQICYNWRKRDDKWHPYASGSWCDGVCIHNMDVHEGFLFNLRQLRKHGDFVTPWVERPFLWFLSYMDTNVEGFDYKEINERVIQQLPTHVQSVIG